MHDVKALRDDPAAYELGWSARGVADAAGVVERVLKTDADLRAAQTALQAAQSRRNDLSKLIGMAKGRKDEAEATRLMAEVEGLKAAMTEGFEGERVSGQSLRDTLAGLPNLPADDVPEGGDESANVEVRRWGDPRKIAAPKDHADLGEALGLMDFEAAARMSGSRFVALKGGLARMERALGQFMLDLHTGDHGYTEVNPPLLVRDEAMFGTGQLPKFGDDLFEILGEWKELAIEVSRTASLQDERVRLLERLTGTHTLVHKRADEARSRGVDVRWTASLALEFAKMLEQLIGEQEAFGSVFPAHADRLEQLVRQKAGHFFLIPTAEVSLTNLVREEITSEDALPLRMTALTPCFRAEAGASGRDTRGMIRQHQFNKVELVSVTTPEQAAEEHERMTACAETVLQRLGLPYRTMLLCTGDMGFSARKTYDIEVWLPSQATYREISSCSTCGEFQARRMDARIRKAGEKGTRFPHTLNGSGTAVGRALVAVMENYQDEGGRIAVPDVLKPYMGGLTHVERVQ